MKKLFTVFLVFVIVFSSCAAPQAVENDGIRYVRVCAITEGYTPGPRGGFIIPLAVINSCAKSFKGKTVNTDHESGMNRVIGFVNNVHVNYNHVLKKHFIEAVLYIDDEEAASLLDKKLWRFLSIGIREVTPMRIPGSDAPILMNFVGYEISFVSHPRNFDAKVLEVSKDRLSLWPVMKPKKEKK